jgi:hypothetical protein
MLGKMWLGTLCLATFRLFFHLTKRLDLWPVLLAEPATKKMLYVTCWTDALGKVAARTRLGSLECCLRQTKMPIVEDACRQAGAMVRMDGFVACSSTPLKRESTDDAQRRKSAGRTMCYKCN